MNNDEQEPKNPQVAKKESLLAQALGKELRKARLKKGLTRRELAVPLGVSTQTIIAYEGGIRNCTVKRFAKICQALDVAPEDLLQRALAKAEANSNDEEGLLIDLIKLANADLGTCKQLSRWAKSNPNKLIWLSLDRIKQLATLLNLAPDNLFKLLEDYRDSNNQ